jgi:putative N6-adenine-specific DNA methylase
MPQNQTIVVTCGKGINQILADEVKDHGYQPSAINPFSVEIKGDMGDCLYLNLHLRTANKVLMLIKRFRASHPDQLYKSSMRIAWEDHISDKGYVCVTSFIQNEFIKDTRFGNLKLKDAIVDRIHSQRGKRPDSGPNRDKTVVYLHWVNSDCHLYFDTSGETISKHGYRRIPFKAPLRESLAAALIKATHWRPGESFVNPMAGSGTLAIEAAMMAANIAPGLLRDNFGFMHLRDYQPEQWHSLVQQARKQIRDNLGGKILVNDSSLEALRAARKNATWAGVDAFIEFHHGDFTKVPLPEAPGAVMLNPEYGSRLGQVEQLAKTYREIGDFFKTKCAGYWGYIFSGNPELTKRIGLRSSRKIPFYNGQIECRLIEYELYSGTKKSPHRD